MTSDVVLSILMLGSIAMLLGGIALWRRRGLSRQVWLMLVLAAVMAVNVAIWVVPLADGTAPDAQLSQPRSELARSTVKDLAEAEDNSTLRRSEITKTDLRNRCG